jgi:RNA polymerase sigma factor (sigma-70 family)
MSDSRAAHPRLGIWPRVTPWALINPARLAGSGLLRTQTDARLVDLVRAGNDTAFEAIVLRYQRSLLRHCRRLLPAARAEDAVQQSLLRALEAMRADRRELDLGPWLHRIAHNTAIDSLRRLDSHWEELDEDLDGVEPTHAAAERRARFRSVVSSMGELPARQRRALVLRELEGRSYDEISVDLGVSGAVVRGLLNRARNTMRAGASALVPPALVVRLVGSQPAVRAVELADPPGTSALVAKATAAVAAAGAVAVFAVTGTPVSERGRVPHAEARVQPPDLDRGRDADSRPDLRPGAAQAGSAGRRSASPDGTRRRPGDRGSGREGLAFAQRPADAGDVRAGEGLPERDAPAAAPRRRRAPLGPGPVGGGGDPTGRSPGAQVPAASAGVDDDDGPAGADDGPEDADDGPEDDTPVAGYQPPDDDAADDADDDEGAAPAPTAVQLATSPETAPEEDDDEDGADD